MAKNTKAGRPRSGRKAETDGRPAPAAAPVTRVQVRADEDDVTAFGPQHRFPDRTTRGLGWLRDLPDFRDSTLHAPALKFDRPHFKALKTAHGKATKPILSAASETAALPADIDNRKHCSPIEDQGNLGSCTAQAGAGMMEYMERRAAGKHIDASRLFLYKVTRKLLGWSGDTGAFLRTTMKAMALFGLPPEQWWPYRIATYDQEPDSFLYAYGANYQALQYLRLDPPGVAAPDVLTAVKAALSKGYAVMFGFSVYSSLGRDADIPFPVATDRLDGGHAVLAVGYDDHRPCRNAADGALLIRNSWGLAWGDEGYGWLPYGYVLTGLADDFWTCFKLEWVDSGAFE